jgi:hypothetical protein
MRGWYLTQDEFDPTIPLVAAFGRIGACRTVLSEAHRIDSSLSDTLLNQILPNCIGTAVTQPDIVFLATPFIGVTTNRELKASVLRKEADVALQLPDLIGSKISLIVVKINWLHG